MGKKVLLMDCDLRRSNYAKDFHIPREERIGVSDVLKKKATLQEVLLKSDIDNLFFLQAGTVPPNPAELLQSPSFQKIITSLKNVFEYIIVDAPPLASVIDAAIISKCTDGVVYVIASDEISCRVIRRGLEQLERAGARILGTVLNRIKFSNRALYGTYGTNKYYYGYYHGYYGEEE